eukprot:snap_masked-scaffold_23-processed-gene-1.6-mRNA-1 protein AED:0.09 eAED:0.10 QI:0/-1/0/1/-1/1/1/0/983
MVKKKQQQPNKCPIPNCTKRLTPAFVATCPKCNLPAICKLHTYDHACQTSKPISSSTPQNTLKILPKKKKEEKKEKEKNLEYFAKAFQKKEPNVKKLTKELKTFLKSYSPSEEDKKVLDQVQVTKDSVSFHTLIMKKFKVKPDEEIFNIKEILNIVQLCFISSLAKDYKSSISNKEKLFEDLFTAYEKNTQKDILSQLRKTLSNLIKIITDEKLILEKLNTTEETKSKQRVLNYTLLPNIDINLSSVFPILLNTLLQDLFSTSTELSKSANKAFTSLHTQIKNPEIQNIHPLIFKALLSRSQKDTFKCLEAFLDLTVVNPIGTVELCLLFPLLQLALRQRDSLSVQAALITLSNICPLVETVSDLTSHRDEILPRISTLQEDSNPKTRKLAVDAKEALLSLEETEEEDSGLLSGKNYLVYLPTVILGFASRLLLKRTKLAFEKGRIYGFVGLNGVGKTTLLDRLALKDIAGFPKELKVHYVRHEIVDTEILTPSEYLQKTQNKSIDEINLVLKKVDFTKELLEKTIQELSGGWKMKLAIAESMLAKAELLLLDEPTNHLDEKSINFLGEYLKGLISEEVCVCIVSHEYDFLSEICTDIVHIHSQKLTYYNMTFKEFQKLKPEIVSALPRKDNKETDILSILAKDINSPEYKKILENILPIQFPEGQKLQGLTSRGKPVLSLIDVTFKYQNTERLLLENISLRLNLNSRVALLGKNGAGKSTLLKLLIGVLDINKESKGRVWKHHNLRTAYIAQHSLHHLEENLEKTPCQYIQKRFYEGRDKELGKFLTLSLTKEEEEITKLRGEICEVLSRVSRGKKLFYEVRKHVPNKAIEDIKTEFKSLEELEALGKKHAVKLCKMFDEKLKAAQSGMDLRPVTTEEMLKHMKEFGIPSEIATRKIRWMSGGQRCRLVLAAAMWTKPHLVALDEPTNYLDNDTLGALTAALRGFRGGVVVVSHHDGFVKALAKELWHVEEGKVRVEYVKRG